jgi:hypothetical protein
MPEGLRRLATGDSRQLLQRILDQPNLVAAVQALPPQVLGRVIAHVGLEDAGEIVALATTSQLTGIFDDDLWHSGKPGKDETFDADRFALWLEVMLEAGEAFAAQTLAELPEDLVTLAFHRQVLVINIEELAISMSSRPNPDPLDDDAQVEKALESCLAEELGEYRIISRHHESWDTLFGLMVVLDRDHHEFLQRLLDRLAALDAELIEESGGLYQVLTTEESLEADVAGDREDRRAEQGYIAPSSAAAFLALARTSKLEVLAGSSERDAVTRAYFRGLRDEPTRTKANQPTASPKAGRPASSESSDLVDVLREAGIVAPLQANHLIEGRSAGKAKAQLDRFAEALRGLADKHPHIHGDRMRELAYLANVLAAGCSLDGRPMRPVEAARAAVATCNLGLAHLCGGQGKPETDARMLEATAADRLFLVGWNILFHAVVLPAAERAKELLVRAAATGADPDSRRDLERAESALVSASASGKPWAARRSLDALADRLGEPVLAAVTALLGECPALEGRLSQGSQEIEFIATEEQLGAVIGFLEGILR